MNLENARLLTSGIYREEFDVVEYLVSGGTATGQFFFDVPVVNRATDPFGAGWWIDGLLQVVPSPTDSTKVLIDEGSRKSLEYTGTDGSHYSDVRTTDPSTLVKNTGNTWTLTYPDGTVIQFDSSGKETSSTDRNGNATVYSYSGNLLQS